MKTRRDMKRFSLILLSLFVVIPVGLYTKYYNGPGAQWVNDSLGGVFYEIFWCLISFSFFQRKAAWKIASAVGLCTCIVEFSQLWHPVFLTFLRSSTLGRLILGTSFSWTDFPFYFIGCGMGWIWLKFISAHPKETFAADRKKDNIKRKKRN